MAKLVKVFLIFGPVKGSVKVIKKYGQTNFDESLISTLCLPKIELVDQPKESRFQTFLVTREDGQVLYGSGLIVYDRILDIDNDDETKELNDGKIEKYASYCYTLITDTPFIHATKSLLNLIWEKQCDDIIVRSIMNIPLPGKRKCLRIVTTKLDDIYLYRGMTPDLPLLDYPLRELFNFLPIDDFLLAYICILMEFRTLIISQDNYKLMLVGETLTSLLLPLKWCNVYVPILPPIYGATYLDAPTSYIMGINTQVTDLPDSLNHIQCRIYCDEGRVTCDADNLALPLFLNDIKKEILLVINEYEMKHSNQLINPLSSSSSNKRPQPQPAQITYLDDLKFNREIRIIFIKTIRKNILANYERYIVDVPESSSDIRQFDVVSYLSDQPEFMRSFLSKFLETQLFVSFVDENAKRMQQSWLSIFDMDPDELSEHLSDKALENAFYSARRVHLMELRQDHLEDIEVKTVPASPMKLRRKMPGLSSLASRLTFSKSAHRSTSIECSGSVGQPALASSSPEQQQHQQPQQQHRNSVATVSLLGHLSLVDPNLSPSTNTTTKTLTSNSLRPTINLAPTTNLVQQPTVPNGKIIELINEVRDLSKRILIEKLNDFQINDQQQQQQQQSLLTIKESKQQLDIGCSQKIPKILFSSNNFNNLIGSLCDLIERVWAHGAFVSHYNYQQQDNNTACCPLWNHLLAFTRIKLLDTKVVRKNCELPDGSHLNVLLPKSQQSELDIILEESSNLFGSTINWLNNKLNNNNNNNKYNNRKIGPHARELINDLKIIHTLKDVKTDVGKARAFIKLSLEKKKLSDHLKTLIDDQMLLNNLYKPYAFLRCEEEREQFLTYLLTLQAVDLPCFTTTFVSVINTRRMNNNNSTGHMSSTTTNLPAANSIGWNGYSAQHQHQHDRGHHFNTN